MGLLKYLLIGMYFGIVLVKGEVVSWFRIQEMFHLQSPYMYLVIGSAVAIGIITVLLAKTLKLKSLAGEELNLKGKPFNKIGNTVGGVIFGFGWALAGACPGPMYSLLGAGYFGVLIALAFALLGALTYGYLKPHLPH
ncbi:MAG: DUF6691 family protein [Spirochaetota bacterium]